MLFDKNMTWTKRGNIGEARAIYEYTKMGYEVCRTLFDSAKYDLIVDMNGELKRVQVKTTSFKKRDFYVANLKTSGGNSSSNSITNREEGDYDILFILTDDDICYSIPTDDLKVFTSLTLTEKYNQFKIGV